MSKDIKVIYVVTHGQKFLGPNPKMTEDGIREVAALRAFLPDDISEVVCGTGTRHRQVAEALGLVPTRWTSVVGGPDSGQSSEKGGPVDQVALADGHVVPYPEYTTLIDGGVAAKKLVAEDLRHNSVICAGRPSMVMFGVPEDYAKSAAVYRIVVDFYHRTIDSVSQVHAIGQAEPHPV